MCDIQILHEGDDAALFNAQLKSVEKAYDSQIEKLKNEAEKNLRAIDELRNQKSTLEKEVVRLQGDVNLWKSMKQHQVLFCFFCYTLHVCVVVCGRVGA